jgi:ferritin-like metal-binding protein YciE
MNEYQMIFMFMAVYGILIYQAAKLQEIAKIIKEILDEEENDNE